MLLSIQHRTELSYSDRISESVMELRMAPRSDANQTLRGFGLAVGPTAPVFEHTDWLGNRVHQFSVVEFHDRLAIVALSAVDTHSRQAPLASFDDPLTRELGDHRLAEFLRFGGPITEDARLAELVRAFELDRVTRAGDALERLMQGLGTRLRYVKGVTDSSTAVGDALDRGAGVCQDFAHVGIAVLRSIGIPARYVSGYLFRRNAPAELQTHAWCEAFLPSAGWVGIDPTHAATAGDDHVAVAVGRSYRDVPPNRGVFRGDARETINVRVTIDEVTEVPRGLLAPRPAPLEVPSFREGTPAHREQIDYQEEQQQQ
jgi:transglutaminase-like putative cysteine protease